MDWPASSDLSGTDPPTLQQQVPSQSTSELARKQSESDMHTHSNSEASGRPELCIFVEEGEVSDHDQDLTTTDPNQTLSEEQTYRETMSCDPVIYGLVTHP